MLQSEFTERTGFQVTAECYHNFIEPEYNGSTLDKDEWCRQWKRKGGISRAYTWQNHYYEDRIKEANRIQIENEDLQKQVSELKDKYSRLDAQFISVKTRLNWLIDKMRSITAAGEEFYK